MRNIYATNIFGHDTTMAQEYLEDGGRIIPITEGRINIYKTDSLQRKIKGMLKDMAYDDLILIAGNAVVASMVCAYVGHRFAILNLLMWDNNASRYEKRIIEYPMESAT